MLLQQRILTLIDVTHKLLFHAVATLLQHVPCHDTRPDPRSPFTYHFVSANKVHFPIATLCTQIGFLITIDLSRSFVLRSVFGDAGICLDHYHNCICPLWEQVESNLTEQRAVCNSTGNVWHVVETLWHGARTFQAACKQLSCSLLRVLYSLCGVFQVSPHELLFLGLPTSLLPHGMHIRKEWGRDY